MNGSADREQIARGEWGTVAFARRFNGSMPGKEHYDSLDQNTQARFLALFQRMAEKGEIKNPDKFSQEDGRIFAFKERQTLHRFPCFQDGRTWVIADGFLKRGSNRWRRSDFKRAEEVMQEDLSRKASK